MILWHESTEDERQIFLCTASLALRVGVSERHRDTNGQGRLTLFLKSFLTFILYFAVFWFYLNFKTIKK
jgi:hypothetical protein